MPRKPIRRPRPPKPRKRSEVLDVVIQKDGQVIAFQSLERMARLRGFKRKRRKVS